MRHESGFYAGTEDEFIDFAATKIFEDCKLKQSRFKGIDFGSTDEPISEIMLSIANTEADDWHGIKVIPDMFDSSSYRQYMSDAYGGGDFGTCNICLEDATFPYVRWELCKMLNNSLNEAGRVIVWEELR